MIEGLTPGKIVVPELYRGEGLAPPTELLKFTAHYDFELVRGGVVVAKQRVKNGIVNDAKNNLLNRWFNQTGTNTTSWYIGLIDNATFSALAAGDTPASHAGWTEYTNYSIAGGNTTQRGAWGQGTASGQQITNSSPVQFTFTVSSGNIYGIFLLGGDSTKGGTIGTLWSTAALNAVLPVLVNDVLNVNYTLQL